MTLPLAPNSARSPAVDVPATRTDTDSPVASFICEATVRCQISSYSRRSSEDRRVPGHLGRGAEAVPGRADGLVRLLGVLDLAGVDARGVRDVGGAVQLGGLLAGGGDRGLGQRCRVGAHIGDVAVLVQPLRHRHGVLGREAELARGLLLQRGGAERRVRRAAVGLALDAGDGEARRSPGAAPGRPRPRRPGAGRPGCAAGRRR